VGRTLIGDIGSLSLIDSGSSLAHLIYHSGCLRRADLFTEERSALLAEVLAGIPADLAAYPGSTAMTLVEQRLDLGDRCLKRSIVHRSAHGTLDLVR